MDLFADELIKAAFAIVVPILSALLLAVVVQFLRKLGLELSAERQAKLEHTVHGLLLQVEEWGASRVKAGVETKAKDKLEHYLALAAAKIPGITSEEAAALAHSELPKLGRGAAGLVGEVVRAATNPVR